MIWFLPIVIKIRGPGIGPGDAGLGGGATTTKIKRIIADRNQGKIYFCTFNLK